MAVKWFTKKIMELDKQLSDVENQMNQKCLEIPYFRNLLEIFEISESTREKPR